MLFIFKRISKDIRHKKITCVLIIGLSSIGDNLLISPAIKLLKDTYKDASFDIIVGPRAVDFAKDNPLFSDVFVWDKKTGILKLADMLKNRNYDLVVDFRNSIIPFFIRSKYRLTFFLDEFFSKKFFTHEAERIIKFFEPYFCKPDRIELYFPLTSEEISEHRKFFQDFDFFTSGKNVVVINPGAAFVKKRWNKERFVEVARKIISHFDVYVIIVGNSQEYSLAEEIKTMVNSNRVVNIAGKISFRQLAYLLSRASLLITNDTGTMHLASAVKCPVIAIFGPSNPIRYGPIGTQRYILHTKRDCFPCRVESKCKKGFVCMEDITEDEVFASASKVLISEHPNRVHP